MYSRLVKSDQDIVGFIAYSLYKSAKIAYIKQIETETGIPVSETKLQNYDKSQQNQQQIQLYIDKAKMFLGEMNQAIIDVVTSRIEKESTLRHEEMIKSAVASSSHSFWYGVCQSVSGAFLYSFVLILLAATLNFVKPGLLHTIIGLFG